MGRSKEQWIEQTGGFRLGEDAKTVAAQQRVQELAQKLQAEGLTDNERSEYLRLLESLPDGDQTGFL